MVDASGNGNTGTITNAARTASGKLGQGMVFTGAGSYVRVPDAAALDLGATGTVALWANQTAAQNDAGMVHKGESTNFSDEAYSLQFSGTTRRPQIWLNGTASSKTVTATSAGALSLAAWHHVAVTWDASGVSVYLDGALNTAVAGGITPMNSAGALFIGTQVVGQYAYAGTIDEVRVYNRALGLAEIQQAMTTPAVDAAAPVVAMTSPQSGASLSGTALLQASASDNSGAAPAVQFLLDGSPLGAPVGGPSTYTLNWDTALASNGAHTVAARATDGAGNTATSAGVPVTVSNAVAPTVASVTPGTGAPGTSVQASIAGTDLGNATSATFSGAGVTASIGSGGTSASLPVTITISSGAALGARDVAVATSAGSATKTAGFAVAQPAPTVTGISPASGAQGTSFAATISGTALGSASSVAFSGTGVTAVINSGGTPTELPVTITVAGAA